MKPAANTIKAGTTIAEVAGAYPVIGTGTYPFYIRTAVPISVTTDGYLKYIDIDLAFGGTYKVEFTITGTDDCYGRIYKNGVAFGTERATYGTDTFTEDLTFAAGDNLQLYCKKDVGTSSVTAFTVSSDFLLFTQVT